MARVDLEVWVVAVALRSGWRLRPWEAQAVLDMLRRNAKKENQNFFFLFRCIVACPAWLGLGRMSWRVGQLFVVGSGAEAGKWLSPASLCVSVVVVFGGIVVGWAWLDLWGKDLGGTGCPRRAASQHKRNFFLSFVLPGGLSSVPR